MFVIFHKKLFCSASEWLIPVVVLCMRVAATEEEGHGTHLVACRLLVLSLLDEGPEGRQASAQTGHENGRRLILEVEKVGK